MDYLHIFENLELVSYLHILEKKRHNAMGLFFSSLIKFNPAGSSWISIHFTQECDSCNALVTR